jgi:hypothetical protein
MSLCGGYYSRLISISASFKCLLDGSVAERFSKTAWLGVSRMYELFKLGHARVYCGFEA